MFVYVVVIVDETGQNLIDIAGIYHKREKAQWDMDNNMAVLSEGTYEIEEREVQ